MPPPQSPRRLFPRAVVAAVMALAALPAQAQSSLDRLDQRFWIQLGAYRPGIDSEVRVDQRAGAFNGTPLDLERDLGLPGRKTLASLLIGARIDSRWRAEFEYFSLRRSGRQDPLGGPVNVGDATFTAEIDTTFDTKVYRAGAGYSFVRSPQIELGAAFGLHVTDFQVSMTGIGSVNGVPVAVASERTSRTVPLPTVGLYGGIVVSPAWVVTGRVDVLRLRVRGDDGQLINLQANVVYRVTPNVGLGVGYRYNDYLVRGDGAFKGRVDYRFGGPQAFLDIGF